MQLERTAVHSIFHAISLTIRSRRLRVVDQLIRRFQPNAGPSPRRAPNILRRAVWKNRIGVTRLEAIAIEPNRGAPPFRRKTGVIKTARSIRSRRKNVIG